MIAEPFLGMTCPGGRIYHLPEVGPESATDSPVEPAAIGNRAKALGSPWSSATWKAPLRAPFHEPGFLFRQIHDQ